MSVPFNSRQNNYVKLWLGWSIHSLFFLLRISGYVILHQQQQRRMDGLHAHHHMNHHRQLTTQVVSSSSSSSQLERVAPTASSDVIASIATDEDDNNNDDCSNEATCLQHHHHHQQRKRQRLQQKQDPVICWFPSTPMRSMMSRKDVLISADMLAATAMIMVSSRTPVFAAIDVSGLPIEPSFSSSSSSSVTTLPPTPDVSSSTFKTKQINAAEPVKVMQRTNHAETNNRIDSAEAVITDTVYFDVRVSRQDGTFYVRDDLPDEPENRVFTGRLIVDLFGKNAPNYVSRFLSYVDPEYIPGSRTIPRHEDQYDDHPMPSYSRAMFRSIDPETGLLLGGTIPGIQFSEINGSPALQYGGRLIPASLWLEGNVNRQQQQPSTSSSPLAVLPRISHASKGLLTHRSLDVTPEFGITTRSDTSELDATHVVFGRVRMDSNNNNINKNSSNGSGDGTQFLQLMVNLPTYNIDRPTSSSTGTGTLLSGAVDDAAAAVFTAQRDFFRTAAKSIGDTRIDKVYQGKLLRRVEVTRTGILPR
jgi:cyclophilin family peptidyl-prolyl cis-trans isomerase